MHCTDHFRHLPPQNASEELLERLVDSGMDMMRLNFSHGSHEWFEEMVSKLRR